MKICPVFRVVRNKQAPNPLYLYRLKKKKGTALIPGRWGPAAVRSYFQGPLGSGDLVRTPWFQPGETHWPAVQEREGTASWAGEKQQCVEAESANGRTGWGDTAIPGSSPQVSELCSPSVSPGLSRPQLCRVAAGVRFVWDATPALV